jgi:hypothetical protein
MIFTPESQISPAVQYADTLERERMEQLALEGENQRYEYKSASNYYNQPILGQNKMEEQ